MARLTPARPSTRSTVRPAAAIAETLPRTGLTIASTAALVSGQVSLWGLYLYAGETITNITFVSSSTALVAGTNQWFTLAAPDGTRVGITGDDGATAWNANSKKTLALAAAYLVPTDGVYYVGCMVAAATVPTLAGVSNHGVIVGEAPIISARDSAHTGLTNPASAPPGYTLSALSLQAYAWVS